MFKAFSLPILALIAWTVWGGWRKLPVEMQRHAQIAAAINIPLFLLFCSPGEMRDFSMLYIVFLLLLAANLSIQTETGGRMAANAASTVSEEDLVHN
jgi:hypothetical protein